MRSTTKKIIALFYTLHKCKENALSRAEILDHGQKFYQDRTTVKTYLMQWTAQGFLKEIGKNLRGDSRLFKITDRGLFRYNQYLKRFKPIIRNVDLEAWLLDANRILEESASDSYWEMEKV